MGERLYQNQSSSRDIIDDNYSFTTISTRKINRVSKFILLLCVFPLLSWIWKKVHNEDVSAILVKVMGMCGCEGELLFLKFCQDFDLGGQGSKQQRWKAWRPEFMSGTLIIVNGTLS